MRTSLLNSSPSHVSRKVLATSSKQYGLLIRVNLFELKLMSLQWSNLDLPYGIVPFAFLFLKGDV